MIKFLLKIIPCAGLLIATCARADINMAVIAPQAGEFKAFGDELIDGVQIAVDDINARGGLRGEKINLIRVDDQCNDIFAVSTAEMMAVNTSDYKISAVIGPYCQNSFKKVSDIYAKAKIIQIIPTAVSERNAALNHSGLVKMVGTIDRQGTNFYNYYKKNFDGEEVAVVYDGMIDDVVEVASAIQDEFRKAGQPQDMQGFNFASYNGNIDKMADDILATNASVAYIMGSPKKIAKLARILKYEDPQFAIFTNRYQGNDEYMKIMDDYAEGSYALALPSLKDNPAFTETLVRLRLIGAEPEGLGVYGYSAVRLWEELVEKADSFDYAKLSSVLNNSSFETAWGEMEFNNGNPGNAVNYSVYQVQGGEYTQVY